MKRFNARRYGFQNRTDRYLGQHAFTVWLSLFIGAPLLILLTVALGSFLSCLLFTALGLI